MPPNPSRRTGRVRDAVRRALPPTLALLSLALASCQDSPTAARGRGGSRFTRADSAAHGLLRTQAKPRFDAAPIGGCTSGPACPRLVSVTPSLSQGDGQPNPIELTFAGPVDTLAVQGYGAIQCSSGQYGTLVAYDSTGAEIGRAALSLPHPEDCSPDTNPDDVTYGAQAVLKTAHPIARAVIEPMAPLTFPVYDWTGYASASYSLQYGFAGRPEVKLTASQDTVSPGDSVTFTAKVTTSKGDYRVVEWRFEPDPPPMPPRFVPRPPSWPFPGEWAALTGGPAMNRAALAPRSALQSRPPARPPAANKGTTASRAATPGLRFDAAGGDSTASDSTGDNFWLAYNPFTYTVPTPPLDSIVPTTPCDPSVGLVCTMGVGQSGTVLVTVEVEGTRYEASIAARRYPKQCPNRSNIDRVQPPSEGPFSTSTNLAGQFGAPRNGTWRPVTPWRYMVYGPFARTDTSESADLWVPFPGLPERWPLAWYQPRSSKMLDGPTPLPPESYVLDPRDDQEILLWCNTWFNTRNQKWEGRLIWSDIVHLSWTHYLPLSPVRNPG